MKQKTNKRTVSSQVRVFLTKNVIDWDDFFFLGPKRSHRIFSSIEITLIYLMFQYRKWCQRITRESICIDSIAVDKFWLLLPAQHCHNVAKSTWWFFSIHKHYPSDATSIFILVSLFHSSVSASVVRARLTPRFHIQCTPSVFEYRRMRVSKSFDFPN